MQKKYTKKLTLFLIIILSLSVTVYLYKINSISSLDLKTQVISEDAFTRVLRRQTPLMQGTDVSLLQQRLFDLGYTEVGTVDGIFGINTQTAVRNFQTANNLTSDGIVGPTTWYAIFSTDVTVTESPANVWACYGTPNQVSTGQSVIWRVILNGETAPLPASSNTYHYLLIGTDGLSLQDDVLTSKTYSTAGEKVLQVTISETLNGEAVLNHASCSVNVTAPTPYTSTITSTEESTPTYYELPDQQPELTETGHSLTELLDTYPSFTDPAYYVPVPVESTDRETVTTPTALPVTLLVPTADSGTPAESASTLIPSSITGTQAQTAEQIPPEPSACPGLNYPTDISGHWAESFIKQAYDICVVRGYEDGTFRPESQITRASAVRLAMLFANIEPNPNCYDEDCGTPYIDLEMWMGPWIRPAWEGNLIQGTTETTFEPNRLITRAEASALSANAFDIPPHKGCYTPNCGAGHPDNLFKDILHNWQGPYIRALWDMGIIEGAVPFHFEPDRPITRAEIIKILAKSKNKK